jgi:hypothetical protein
VSLNLPRGPTGLASELLTRTSAVSSTGTDFQTLSAFVNDKWDFNR